MISTVQHFDGVRLFCFFEFLSVFKLTFRSGFYSEDYTIKILHFSFENFAIAKYINKEKNVLNAEYGMFFQQGFASKIKTRSLYLPIIVKMQNIFRLIKWNNVHISDIFYYHSANINGMSDVKKPGGIYKPGA